MLLANGGGNQRIILQLLQSYTASELETVDLRLAEGRDGVIIQCRKIGVAFARYSFKSIYISTGAKHDGIRGCKIGHDVFANVFKMRFGQEQIKRTLHRLLLYLIEETKMVQQLSLKKTINEQHVVYLFNSVPCI